MTQEEKAKQAEERAAEQTGQTGVPAGEASQPTSNSETTGNGDVPAGEGTAPLSNRDQYRNAYKEDYPDMDIDDEDAFYEQAGKNYSELKDKRQTEKNLSDALDKFPGLNDMVVLAGRGENPWTWLGENLGMDIRDLANDPEFATQIGEALDKYRKAEADKTDKEQASQKEKADYDQSVADNVQNSANALAEIQQEKGLSDEDCSQIWADFFNNVYEPAKDGIVSKETWQAYVNSRNYDNDIESARKDAAAKALNEKFQNQIGHSEESKRNLPPSMPSGAGRRSGNSGGFFSGVD